MTVIIIIIVTNIIITTFINLVIKSQEKNYPFLLIVMISLP